jgi:hypothetical protein
VFDNIAEGRRNIMHIPLLIAILALLVWTLLPQLDRYNENEVNNDGVQAYLSRLAHWVNN